MAHLDFGDPENQRIKTSTSLPSGTETADQYEYFDGLGRTWRSMTIGDGSSPTTRIDTEYDLRGNVSKVSLPYFGGVTPYFTTTTFDWANRPVKITNPNNSFKSIAFGLQDTVSVSDNIPLEYTRTDIAKRRMSDF